MSKQPEVDMFFNPDMVEQSTKTKRSLSAAEGGAKRAKESPLQIRLQHPYRSNVMTIAGNLEGIAFDRKDFLQFYVRMLNPVVGSPSPVRLMVCTGGMTLVNVHRAIAIALGYKDNLGVEHSFYVDNRKYGSGAGPRKGRKSDGKEKLMSHMNVIGAKNIEYYFGHLKCQLVLEAVSIGKSDADSTWVPRVCVPGSFGTFPSERMCLEGLDKFKSQSKDNFDSINRKLMVTRFGANQTHNQQGRKGPEVWCLKTDDPKEIIARAFRRRIYFEGMTEEDFS